MLLILTVIGPGTIMTTHFITDEQPKLAESVGLSPAWMVCYARQIKFADSAIFLNVRGHIVAF